MISHVANLNEGDFETAIESARVAQQQYCTLTTASQRGAIIRTWYELVIKNKKDRTFAILSKLERAQLTLSSGNHFVLGER
jgi:acyl-CoA reductase-like NAD-dependent aldehyde dehydrogenase